MKIIYKHDIFSAVDCVATIGFFDGVHLGHRHVLIELKKNAQDRGLPSAVVTFSNFPRSVLSLKSESVLINTLEEKLEQISSIGIDICYVLDFDYELASLTAFQFMKDILYDQYKVKFLLIGYDHRFGKDRAEGFEQYLEYGKKIGIDVVRLSDSMSIENQNISSTLIRQAIQQGDVELANSLLSYNFSFEGEVVSGEQLGRKIGFPTANVKLPADKIFLANAVYVVCAFVDGFRYCGMMNIGHRPTLASNLHKTIEVHLFDFNSDIYGKQIKVEVLAKLRNEIKFNGLEQLIEQLYKDKERAFTFLSNQGLM